MASKGQRVQTYFTRVAAQRPSCHSVSRPASLGIGASRSKPSSKIEHPQAPSLPSLSGIETVMTCWSWPQRLCYPSSITPTVQCLWAEMCPPALALPGEMSHSPWLARNQLRLFSRRLALASPNIWQRSHAISLWRSYLTHQKIHRLLLHCSSSHVQLPRPHLLPRALLLHLHLHFPPFINLNVLLSPLLLLLSINTSLFRPHHLCLPLYHLLAISHAQSFSLSQPLCRPCLPFALFPNENTLLRFHHHKLTVGGRSLKGSWKTSRI